MSDQAVEDLRRALVTAAGALREAHAEFEDLQGIPVPISDKLLNRLRQREWLATTLATITAADATRRAAALAAYAQAKADDPDPVHPDTDGHVPVLPERREATRDALEQLRRMYLTSPAVRDALDEVPDGWH